MRGNVYCSALFEAKESELVDDVENLPQPFVIYVSGLGESCADHGFELVEAARFLLLADFVVVASDYNIGVFGVAGCKADVVVWVCLIVDQAVFNAGVVGSERFQSCDYPYLLKSHAGGLDRVLAGNGMAVFCAYSDFFRDKSFFFEGHHFGAGEIFENLAPERAI